MFGGVQLHIIIMGTIMLFNRLGLVCVLRSTALLGVTLVHVGLRTVVANVGVLVMAHLVAVTLGNLAGLIPRELPRKALNQAFAHNWEAGKLPNRHHSRLISQIQGAL